jgi:hypothetical protein
MSPRGAGRLASDFVLYLASFFAYDFLLSFYVDYSSTFPARRKVSSLDGK